MPIKLGDCDENEEGSFFFWLAKQRNLGTTPPPKESLVIWLNGGPGK
jgi:carboxypeptidase C (cathepsin A)